MKKRIIKKYYLKNNIKAIVFFGIFSILTIATIKIYLQRIDAINKGDLILINQNNADK